MDAPPVRGVCDGAPPALHRAGRVDAPRQATYPARRSHEIAPRPRRDRAEMHPMYPPARPSAQSRRDLAEIRLRDHLRQAHHAERRVQPAAVGRDVDHGLEDTQRLRGGERGHGHVSTARTHCIVLRYCLIAA